MFFGKEQGCHVCGVLESHDQTLRQCSACKSIWYCSRACQVKDWKYHKSVCQMMKDCTVTPGSVGINMSVNEEEERKERRRVGTSDGDPLRENPLALRLNLQGIVAKRAGDIEKAIALYTQAIDLHPYDHNFFHNRCSAYKQVPSWDNVVLDAQRCLDLCPTFPLGWCNLLQGYIYTMQLEKAKQIVEVAPRFADPTHEHYQKFFLPDLEWCKHVLSDPKNYPLPELRSIHDNGHPLCFIYTNGLHLRGQQELLVVDVPWSSENIVMLQVLTKVVKQLEVNQQLQLGDSFNVAGYTVSAVPVQDEEQLDILKRDLLGQKMINELIPGGVVLLHIVGNKKNRSKKKQNNTAISPEQARSYVDSVVEHAVACQKRYGLGLPLGDGNLVHSGL